MPDPKRKRIIRLLGVGFDAEDGHTRVTQGDKFDVIMGSDDCHEYLRQLIQDIEEAIKKRGLSLDELTPGEFTDIMESVPMRRHL